MAAANEYFITGILVQVLLSEYRKYFNTSCQWQTKGFVNVYALYNWQRFSKLRQSTVRQDSQSYTQRLTPGTITVPLCTGLFPPAGKLKMKSR